MLFMGAGEHTGRKIEERKKQFDDCYSMLGGLQQFGLQGSEESPEQFAREEQALRDTIGLFLQKFAEDFDLKLDWCEKAELIED